MTTLFDLPEQWKREAAERQEAIRQEAIR